MGSFLLRKVRTYLLQGHSVQNTSLENRLCTVKLPMLPALLPQSWGAKVEPALFAWLATQVCPSPAEWHKTLHAHALPLHTHTHTEEHTAVPVLEFVAPAVNASSTLSLFLSLFDLEAELHNHFIDVLDSMPLFQFTENSSSAGNFPAFT